MHILCFASLSTQRNSKIERSYWLRAIYTGVESRLSSTSSSIVHSFPSLTKLSFIHLWMYDYHLWWLRTQDSSPSLNNLRMGFHLGPTPKKLQNWAIMLVESNIHWGWVPPLIHTIIHCSSLFFTYEVELHPFEDVRLSSLVASYTRLFS